jgi:inorganic pyrophosphatase
MIESSRWRRKTTATRHAKHIKDLGKEFVEELEEFFVNYHELSGKKYRILDVRGPREAKKRIESGVREARNR